MDRKIPIYFIRATMFVWLVLFFMSCQKDIVVDDTDNVFPVKINLTEKDGVRTIEWDQFNSKSFKKYIIVESKVKFVNGSVPKFNSNISLFQEIEDVTKTSFKIISLPKSNTSYLKLYVDLGNRIIESKELELTNYLITNQGFITTFYYDNQNLVYGLDLNSRKILVYNLKNFELEREIIFDNSFFLNQVTVLNVIKDAIHLFSNVELVKISLSSGKLVTSSFTTGSGQSMISIGDFLFTSHLNVNSAVNIWKLKENNALAKSLSRSNGDIFRNLAVFDSATYKFVEFTPSLISVSSYNPTNNTVSQVKNVTPVAGDIKALYADVVRSKDNNFFIPSNSGVVYDRDFKNVGKVPSTNSVLQIEFSYDNKFIYTASQVNNFAELTLSKYTFPNMELVDSKKLNNFTFQKFISTQEGLVVIVNDAIFGTTNVYRIKF